MTLVFVGLICFWVGMMLGSIAEVMRSDEHERGGRK